jgi:flagellar hook-associated protein 2
MSIRISGLVSGMDTENIIKDMLKTETSKIDRQKQQKQILEWRRDSYRETNLKLLSFRNSLADLKLPSTFGGKSVECSDTSVLAATATAYAQNGTHVIKVNSLMAGVTRISTTELAGYKDTLAEQFGLTGTISFTMKGKDGVSHEYTFDTAAKNINDVVNAINANAATSGINAGYSPEGNRFVLATADKGAEQVITVEADDGAFLKDVLKLGLDAGVEYRGTDASIDYDGAAGITFKSNQFTLNDINFDLKKAGETLSITIGQDIDAAVEKIKAFVESYNSVMENINLKLNERREYDKSSHSFKYMPLTDEQRKEMSEDQIKKWEEMAKKGIMNRESLLSSISSDIRMIANGMLTNCNAVKILEPGVTLSSKSEINSYASTLADQFGISGTVSFTLKGEDGVNYTYSFDSSTKNMNDVLNAVNADTAKTGIVASYSNNRFTLATVDKGPAAFLQVVADGNLFLKDTLKLGINPGTYTAKSNLIDPVQDVRYLEYQSLSAIGINTGIYSPGSKDNGKLTIDEDQLRQALQYSPGDVYNLFNRTQTVLEDGQYKTYDVGVGLKLYNTLSNAVTSLNSKAGASDAIYDNSFITNDINRIDERIDILEERMKRLEDRYWRQFTALEKAVQQANMQSQWLMQKLGLDSQQQQ